MTAGVSDKHERTITFADIAIGRIKTLRLPAEPRDYEIWYNYATGHIPALNRAIDTTLASKGTLDPDAVDAIHDTYFSPARLTDRIDSVGARVAAEIGRLISAIDSADRASSDQLDRLAEVNEQLDSMTVKEDLSRVVATLIRLAGEFSGANRQLEQQFAASRQKIQELQDDLDAVRHESLTDPLTTLANRKCFDQSLRSAVEVSTTTDTPLTLMMIDVDHFKSFNDTFGHLTGDQVLRLVALCVKQHVKGQDLAARYGGEEFAVILPQTPLRQATLLAEQIRRAVMRKELMKRSTGESLGRVTVSVGVAGARVDDTMQGLIERADECLYAAKRSGRNRTVCEPSPIQGLRRRRVA